RGHEAGIRPRPDRRARLRGLARAEVRPQRYPRHGSAPAGHRLPEEHVPVRGPRRVSGGRKSGAHFEGALRVRRVAVLLLVAWCATPQVFDREKSAREYVQFLVLQLDQWSREYPQQFYAALMKPPVDSSKMSEAAKSGAAE